VDEVTWHNLYADGRVGPGYPGNPADFKCVAVLKVNWTTRTVATHPIASRSVDTWLPTPIEKRKRWRKGADRG
jgi:hypothetical protein